MKRRDLEPIASRLVDESSSIEAMRQRLQECVSISTWSDDEMFRRVTRLFERELPLKNPTLRFLPSSKNGHSTGSLWAAEPGTVVLFHSREDGEAVIAKIAPLPAEKSVFSEAPTSWEAKEVSREYLATQTPGHSKPVRRPPQRRSQQ